MGPVIRLVNNSSVPTRSATPWGAIFSLFLGLLYGVSPIDLIPDLIPFLGLIDDAAIVPIMLILAFFQYMKAKKQRVAVPAESKVIVMPNQVK